MDTTATAPRSQAANAMAVAGFGLMLAALPAFLVGGLAVQIRAELGLSEVAIGAAVSLAFLTTGLFGHVGGFLADRLGARRAIVIGAACSSTALAGIGFGARSWLTLCVFLFIGGLAIAVTDPALAVLINRSIARDLQGLAFGIKESSIPFASLVAGVAVPVIAVQFGWRWAFLTGLICICALAILLPRLDVDSATPGVRTAPGEATPTPLARATHPTEPQRAMTPPSPSTLILVVLAMVCGMAAAGGVGVFLTQSAVGMGMSPSAAGFLLAAGGIAGIVTRLGMGIVADRSNRQWFGFIAAMLVAGAAAMFAGSFGHPVLLTVGTLGVFSAGWGWSGLLFLSLVRAMPDTPGRAGGVGVTGLTTGTALGPLLFGLVAGNWSYAAAWRLSGVLALAAAATMWRVSVRLPSQVTPTG